MLERGAQISYTLPEVRNAFCELCPKRSLRQSVRQAVAKPVFPAAGGEDPDWHSQIVQPKGDELCGGTQARGESHAFLPDSRNLTLSRQTGLHKNTPSHH